MTNDTPKLPPVAPNSPPKYMRPKWAVPPPPPSPEQAERDKWRERMMKEPFNTAFGRQAVAQPAHLASPIRRGSDTSEYLLTWVVTIAAAGLLGLYALGAVELPDGAVTALCLLLGGPVSVYTLGRAIIKRGVRDVAYRVQEPPAGDAISGEEMLDLHNRERHPLEGKRGGAHAQA